MQEWRVLLRSRQEKREADDVTSYSRLRHQAVGKETGKTSDIERCNHTLRQRVGRLARKS